MGMEKFDEKKKNPTETKQENLLPAVKRRGESVIFGINGNYWGNLI